MAKLQSRDDLVEYCLMKLGHPVINIEMDEDQQQLCVDDALQFFQDFHIEGTEKTYWIYPSITDEDISNRYIALDETIVSVDRVFPFQSSITSPNNIFDLRYQLMLNNIWDFSSASFVNYEMTLMHLQTLNILFTGEIPFRFKPYKHLLNIDWSWGTGYGAVGSPIVIECYRITDPETYTDIYNDRFMKNYCTALFKLQWAHNLQKFSNILLPGGVTMNGIQLYNQAMEEKEELEQRINIDYAAPLDFYTG